MKSSTKKWLLLKLSSSILIPFLIWFLVNFISLIDSDYQLFVSFFKDPISKGFITSFLVFAFFFYSLTISEIFEDYIKSEKIKNVANKLCYIFAIIILFITLITIYKV
mgnify:CR=1 FL=1